MRAMQNLAGGSRQIASAVIWAMIVGFIATWIYEYDGCKAAATDPSPQVWCLVTSLFSAYFTWLVMAIAAFLKLATTVL